MMTGVIGNEVELRPLSEAWEKRTRFDPALLRIAHVLAT